MGENYMETLLDVVEIVLKDNKNFSKAKRKSHVIVDCLEDESFAVILTALYLTVIAVIDTIGIARPSNKHFN
jgi:hypothetical protein